MPGPGLACTTPTRPGHARVGHRHEHGGGLHPHEHRPHGAFVEVVVEKLGVAGQAEDVLDALGLERLARPPPTAYAATPHHSVTATASDFAAVTISERLDALVLAVGDAKVTGTEDDTRDARRLVERRVGRRAEVDRMLGARRRDRRPADARVRRSHRLHDRMLPRGRRGRPVVDPLEARRMVAQPRVEAGDGEHVLLDLRPHVVCRLVGGYQSRVVDLGTMWEVERDVEPRVGSGTRPGSSEKKPGMKYG